ncbi:flagellar hook-length control protein [Myxococcus stipitatus DSM 14675]|uniref:Flagellar hook-length control protein n=1 Tax=Myxococcus stipitatus (strain DSM 14675 / JCM 12634 / Mx s8) TaxID=1278073 RepID=L7UGL6_MYXSD|nr:flagellar hook-length control protein [Myxococcus stipitatus DSM 14675]
MIHRINWLATVSTFAILLTWALPLPAHADNPGPPTLLTNAFYGRCMVSGAREIVTRNCTVDPENWEFVPVPAGPAYRKFIRWKLLPSGCLERGPFDGETFVNACNGGIRQQWDVMASEPSQPPAGQRGIQIQNADTRECIDTRRLPWPATGVITYLYTCAGSIHQQWNINDLSFLMLHGEVTEIHKGMTWTVREQRAGNIVHVGSDSFTNPYEGDTHPSEYRRVLCILRQGQNRPPNVPAPNPYNGWSGGTVKTTVPIHGNQLFTRAVADQICVNSFGFGWTIATFHDGGGWSFWALGTLPIGERFWVAIADQPANPWNYP